ncbi:GNAT family N-acetyltransferase [Rhizobium sp. BE258]|uniref:GNAT family N-acetyltransferase n=1 Tax=Rhizobium sp. BE258 TaxID=2817722 RepID=UPI0028609040|nr:GNAT family N-acetyltransferase [Rhizobium sp. BE258]MDR7146772.1 ribosomal-protein-alanine N-acetyltransferase [Rhizobium sp. BE258]
MTVADHIVVGEVGFAAWLSNIKGEEVFSDSSIVAAARKAFVDYPASAKGDVAVAEIGGKVVGWAAREDAPAYISDLWVDPAFQGRGIGAVLLAHFVSVISGEGYRIVRIDTRATNTGAIRLYERAGFSIVRRGFERDASLGVDLEMVKLEMHLR